MTDRSQIYTDIKDLCSIIIETEEVLQKIHNPEIDKIEVRLGKFGGGWKCNYLMYVKDSNKADMFKSLMFIIKDEHENTLSTSKAKLKKLCEEINIYEEKK